MKAVLSTERLALREFREGDLAFLVEVLGDPETMSYWPRPYTSAEAKDWLERQRARYRRDGFGYWLACLKESGEPIGQAGLMAIELDGMSQCAVGWIVHSPFWRQGYGYEAANATVEYGFNVLAKDRLIALVRPENKPSLELARKLGMREAGTTIHAGLVHTVFEILRPKNEHEAQPE